MPLGQDLYQALRRLARSPAFAALAALTLSLGIGVNAALFSVLDALLLRPLPYADSDRVVLITAAPQAFVRFTLNGFELWPADLGEGAFASIGLYAAGGLNLGGEPTERVRAAEVTPGFFEALGVRTALGRAFTATDVRQTPQVVVIGHRLWHRRFAADPFIVGRSVILNGRSFVIIGVMPPRAEFPSAAELWIPSGAADHLGDGVPWPRIVGRLAPTVTSAQARDQLVRIMYGYAGGQEPQRRSTVAVTRLRAALVGEVRPVLLLVAAAALLVLIVACTNAASLLLARVAARQHEFAVRRALGASRGQLVRQVLCESLLLSLAAGIIAVPGALQTLNVARAYLPPTLHGAAEIGLDGRAFAALAALSLLTAILFGIAPAVSIPGRPSADVLRGGSGASPDRFWQRFRSGLVVAEITVALVLLAGAVTIVQKARELLATDLGARGTDALTIDAMLPVGTYGSADSVRQFYERFDTELRALPWIEEVGATNELPGSAPELSEALHILAVLGLYGVINYLVQLRTREIGVRIAIGATPSVVRREVLASGALHASAGIAIGFLATTASGRLVSAYVPRLGQLDPTSLGLLAIAIIAVSVVATWVPALRATRVDPVEALRCE